MASNLQRLFTFAARARKRPLEDFTTEALAAAVRADPTPMLDALMRAGIAKDVSGPAAVVADTQVVIPGGRVDLTLEFAFADSTALSLWIEAKAFAEEHGNQISRYLAAAADLPARTRPEVIVLARRPITDQVRTLRWNDIRSAARGNEHVYWTDLVAFLEENSLADDYDAPITAAEVRAATTTHALMRKIARIAVEFAGTLSGTAAQLGLPRDESKALQHVGNQFRRFRRMLVRSATYPTVMLGLHFHRGPELMVWVEIKKSDATTRHKIFEIAREGGLPEAWERIPTGWARLHASTKVEGSLDRGKALAWLGERFDELERHGVLAAVVAGRGV